MKINEFSEKLGPYCAENFEKIKTTIFADQGEPGEENVGERVLASKDPETILSYLKIYHKMTETDDAEISGRIARLIYKFGRAFGNQLNKEDFQRSLAQEIASLYLQTVEKLFINKQGKIGSSGDEERFKEYTAELVAKINNLNEGSNEAITEMCRKVSALTQKIVAPNAAGTSETAPVLVPAGPFVVDRVAPSVSNGPIDLCSVRDLAERAVMYANNPQEASRVNDVINARLLVDKAPKDPATAISVNGQRYVLSSLPRTQEEASMYLSTVIERGGSLFVSLLEGNEATSRYNNFWTEEKIKQLDLNGWQVVQHETKTFKTGTTPNEKKEIPYLQETTVTLKKGDEEKKITHLHYNKWRDHKQTPDEALFDTMLERIEELRVDPSNIVAANCKGGIGRSGNTIAALYMRSHIKSLLDAGIDLHEIEIDIPGLIADLRLQRPRALTGSKHWAPLYRAAARYCDKVAQEMIKQ